MIHGYLTDLTMTIQSQSIEIGKIINQNLGCGGCCDEIVNLIYVTFKGNYWSCNITMTKLDYFCL